MIQVLRQKVCVALGGRSPHARHLVIAERHHRAVAARAEHQSFKRLVFEPSGSGEDIPVRVQNEDVMAGADSTVHRSTEPMHVIREVIRVRDQAVRLLEGAGLLVQGDNDSLESTPVLMKVVQSHRGGGYARHTGDNRQQQTQAK